MNGPQYVEGSSSSIYYARENGPHRACGYATLRASRVACVARPNPDRSKIGRSMRAVRFVSIKWIRSKAAIKPNIRTADSIFVDSPQLELRRYGSFMVLSNYLWDCEYHSCTIWGKVTLEKLSSPETLLRQTSSPLGIEHRRVGVTLPGKSPSKISREVNPVHVNAKRVFVRAHMGYYLCSFTSSKLAFPFPPLVET
ncbi:Uncharacterized protein HZ326_28613 [Fusarium oxysporum f. sp. albedinis]|nr:Uncharacterized protein HZ326_28613 [Fusarium oxysporum f. sp. albedinis]